jgi:uncharacterized protein YaaQ
MKLIIAILRDVDNDPVSHALTSEKLRVTCIASTGGFFRHGATTLLIGVDDDQVETALQIIRTNCSPEGEPGVSKATIFVIKVDQFIHF